MSETNIQIITASYQKADVIDETQAPSAEQGVVGLMLLNNMLADFQADGISLGWFAQTALTAEAPLRDEDLRAVQFCLAAEIAGHFGLSLTPENSELANTAYAKLVKRRTPYTESDLSELPRPQGIWSGSRAV